jgi:hypothetical protein
LLQKRVRQPAPLKGIRLFDLAISDNTLSTGLPAGVDLRGKIKPGEKSGPSTWLKPRRTVWYSQEMFFGHIKRYQHLEGITMLNRQSFSYAFTMRVRGVIIGESSFYSEYKNITFMLIVGYWL